VAEASTWPKLGWITLKRHNNNGGCIIFVWGVVIGQAPVLYATATASCCCYCFIIVHSRRTLYIWYNCKYCNKNNAMIIKKEEKKRNRQIVQCYFCSGNEEMKKWWSVIVVTEFEIKPLWFGEITSICYDLIFRPPVLNLTYTYNKETLCYDCRFLVLKCSVKI